MALAAGDQFAGYTIESVLGTGGMGAVYLAKHPRLPRRDALKLLNPAFSADPSFRARFEREADTAAGLIHKNIVAVYDRGDVDGQLWISMQYVAGTDAAVASRAADGSMTPHRVVHIISEVGAGLDFAHRAGLLHRDVKPANILLAAPDDPTEPEHVLLTDFGIAKSTDDVQHLTGTGNLLATLAYASPEQIEARHLDRRVDIYALGCVLYELLTGQVPFPEATPFATMTAHLTKPPPRPSELVSWLPKGFDAVVAKAMAKNPDDRYSSCRELSLAARAALAASDPAASSPTRAEIAPPVGAAAARDAAAVPPESALSGERLSPSAPQTGTTGPRPPYTVSVRRTSPHLGTVAELGPVTTNYLSATNRIALEELLHRANFFDLPPRLPLEYVIPGDVVQEITVSNEQISRTVTYEREGSRHPAELDEIISLLERLAGWQTRHTAPGAAYPGWTPTGNVPPLGGGAYRPTEAPRPLVGAGVGGPPPSGGAGPGSPTAVGPAVGLVGTGPHRIGGTGPHPVPGPPPRRPSATRKWIATGAAAVVVVAAVVLAIVLWPKATPQSSAPPIPKDLVANADGGSVTVSWSPSSGATGYTLMRSGETVYVGPATTFRENLASGSYNYAVTASNANGDTSVASDLALVAVAENDPWAPLGYIVDQFPGLLPPAPTEKAYNDATCSVQSDQEGSGADGIIRCIDPDGVLYEVMHFPSVDVWEPYVDRFLAANYSGVPVEDAWTTNDVHQGTYFKTGDDEKALPFIFTSFDDADRQNYLIYAQWRDHTTPELEQDWWGKADFSSGAS